MLGPLDPKSKGASAHRLSSKTAAVRSPEDDSWFRPSQPSSYQLSQEPCPLFAHLRKLVAVDQRGVVSLTGSNTQADQQMGAVGRGGGGRAEAATLGHQLADAAWVPREEVNSSGMWRCGAGHCCFSHLNSLVLLFLRPAQTWAMVFTQNVFSFGES